MYIYITLLAILFLIARGLIYDAISSSAVLTNFGLR